MAAVNSVKSQTFGNDVQILIAPEQAFMIGVIVNNTGVDADAEGKKILKAGTPVGGSTDVLTNRQTVISKSTAAPQGVLLHDVDVTAGEQNATMVVEGKIDIEKLDDATKTLINTAASNMSKIILVSGSKV